MPDVKPLFTGHVLVVPKAHAEALAGRFLERAAKRKYGFVAVDDEFVVGCGNDFLEGRAKRPTPEEAAKAIADRAARLRAARSKFLAANPAR